VAAGGFIGFWLFAIVGFGIAKLFRVDEQNEPDVAGVIGVVGIVAGAGAAIYLLFF
jgi:hypothetical protein